jgi:hypothetical protein
LTSSVRLFLYSLGDENFTRSFIRLIDDNDDGIITVKEIKAFTPCEEYDGKRITREFREFGRRVDINDFSQSLTPKQVLNAVEKCIGDVESLAHDENIKVLDKTEVTE